MIKKIPYANHDEWLKIRSQYIGGSDAGAVVGLDEYKSPYSLWLEKRGEIPPFEGNITTKVGGYLEELVAQMFTEETGKKVRKQNYTLVNDKYPWAAANVDRLIVGEKALLECKTTNSFPVMRKVKNGEFPARWFCQVMHYLMVTELEKAYLAVLINCRDFKVFEIERDEDEIKALMEAEQAFWDRVQSNTQPDFNGSGSDTEAVSKMYPGDDADNMIDLFGMETDLLCYQELNRQIKELKRKQEQHKLRLCDAIGNNLGGFINGTKVTWKPQEYRSFQAEAFKKAHPGIDLDSFYKVSTLRTFKIK